MTKRRLTDYGIEIQDPKLRLAVAKTLLDGQLDHRNDTPGSFHFHHAYPHGLFWHTLEVAGYALDIAKGFPQTDLDTLLAAALCHDVCKTREYEVQLFFAGQDIPRRSLFRREVTGGREYWVLGGYYDRIHHIQGGYAAFHAAALGAGMNRDRIEAVGHAMLAHHGPVKDWGSNVQPRSLEAVILHQADYLSAHFGATKERPPADYDSPGIAESASLLA